MKEQNFCPREADVLAIASKMKLQIGLCPVKGYCRGQYCYMLAQTQRAVEEKGHAPDIDRKPPVIK